MSTSAGEERAALERELFRQGVLVVTANTLLQEAIGATNKAIASDDLTLRRSHAYAAQAFAAAALDVMRKL